MAEFPATNAMDRFASSDPHGSHSDIPMRVYAVLIGWAYEGQALIGVYSTRELAEQALKAYFEDGRFSADTSDIEEIVIDAPAALR